MKTEFRKLSAGEFSLMETYEDNVFIFFRKDGKPFTGDMNKMGQLAVGFYMNFMELYEHKSWENQAVQVAFSLDWKTIKLTILNGTADNKRVLH